MKKYQSSYVFKQIKKIRICGKKSRQNFCLDRISVQTEFLSNLTPLLLYSKTGVYRAVLTCTHNLCFEQKYENSQKKLLYLVWACFRNVMIFVTLKFCMPISASDFIASVSKAKNGIGDSSKNVVLNCIKLMDLTISCAKNGQSVSCLPPTDGSKFKRR